MATKKRAVSVKKKIDPVSRLKKPDFRTSIVLQFNENVRLPYHEKVSNYIQEYKVGPWKLMEKKYPGIEIKPLFSNIDPKLLVSWIKKAKKMDPTYVEGNFFSYYKVLCPVESRSTDIFEDLSDWDNILEIQVEERRIAPTVSYNNNPEAGPNQNYLNEAPEGIGAKTIWDYTTPPAGSDGSGIKFIDIETGWTLDHEDLAGHLATCVYGTTDDAGREHGTAVLGVVCAEDNTTGCVGIAPKPDSVKTIAYDPLVGPAAEILESLKHLNFGDVLLIQATNEEDYQGIPCKVPIETTQAEFDAIRLATALGIVVIEPGGNGDDTTTSVNFDDFTVMFQEILNPASSSFKDSGAIIVSASQSALSVAPTYEDTHEIMPWAPRGERVDCYAWGENITTLSSDTLGATDAYTNTFGGTSGAAAIIAGAVMNMQAMVFAEHGYKFSPLQIREILRDSSYGTQLIQNVGSVNPLSIYMPDLEKFITKKMEFPPDLYLRDFVGDTGEPHAGSISASPDVILKNDSVPDPTASFGPASGTDSNHSLSDTAKIGEDNYIYFRVLNQGGIEATNVRVDLYYGLPATLLTPNALTHIGFVTIPTVPAGEILTVSPELIWNVPGPEGHYCFVALVSHEMDPVVDLTEFTNWDWDTYRRYIRENNNITWRNFNIVEVPPPQPAPAPDPEPDEDPLPEPEPLPEIPKKGWKAIDFISPGLPDQDQKMDIEIKSQLPKDAMMLLRTPGNWKKEFYKGNPFVRFNRKQLESYIPVNSRGRTLIRDILFKKSSRSKLKLYIHLPDKYFKKYSYEISIRQLLHGEEIGRVTWKLGKAR